MEKLIIMYVIAGFLSMLLFAWVLTWFFKPGEKIKHMKYQSNVLSRMAEKQGVDKTELELLQKKIFI